MQRCCMKYPWEIWAPQSWWTHSDLPGLVKGRMLLLLASLVPSQELLLFSIMCALHCNISMTSFCTSLPMKTAENHRGFLRNESTMVYLLIVNGFPHFFFKAVFKIICNACVYLCEYPCVCMFINIFLDGSCWNGFLFVCLILTKIH